MPPQFVDGQTSTGSHSSSDEFARELSCVDCRRDAEGQLALTLLAGLKGEAAEFTSDEWQAIRKEALANVVARKLAR